MHEAHANAHGGRFCSRPWPDVRTATVASANSAKGAVSARARSTPDASPCCGSPGALASVFARVSRGLVACRPTCREVLSGSHYGLGLMPTLSALHFESANRLGWLYDRSSPAVAAATFDGESAGRGPSARGSRWCRRATVARRAAACSSWCRIPTSTYGEGQVACTMVKAIGRLEGSPRRELSRRPLHQ